MNPDAIIFNEDFDHFYVTRTQDEMTLAGLEAFVDQYVGTGVTQIYFCPNGMKANYASKVMDPIWQGVDEDAYWPTAKRFLQNTRTLHERGINPYAHWCKYTREKGLSPWLTVRMNDVHFTDQPNAYTLSSFWKSRPDLRRVEDTVHSYADMALDYEKPDVQAYYLALIQELLELTDPDGIELDWMRFVYHFKAGRERFGQEALAAFLFKVRALTKRFAAQRGHDISISVRVPNHLATARGLGLDAVAWAKAGLVDQIVLSQFFSTVDHEVPVEVWKEALGANAQRVKVAVCADMNIRSGPSQPSVHPRAAFYRGWAAAALHRGADRLYLFNYQYLHDSQRQGVSVEERAEYGALLKEMASPGSLASGPRHYPVTYTDVVALGTPLAHLLPAEASLNRFYRFRIYTGPRSEKVTLLLGLGDKAGVNEAVFQARVNGVILAQDAAKDAPVSPLQPGCVRLVAFDVPADALLEGHNMVEFVPRSEQLQSIVWVELRLGCNA